MQMSGMHRFSAVIRVIGSLRLAAVLLMLLLVALACATIFESTHGAEQALLVFYMASWFQVLLVLLCVNILAAIVMRFPFSGRRVGFVLTHGAIVLILAGAWVTQQYAVNGQLNLAEGQTAESFAVSSDTLLVVNRVSRATRELDIPWIQGSELRPADANEDTATSVDHVRFAVDRYLPDTKVTQVVADGVRNGRPAVEVSLSSDGSGKPAWVFADQVTRVGKTDVLFHAAANEAERVAWIGDTGAPSGTPGNAVRVEYDGASYRFDVESCRKEPVSLGQSGLKLRVLRILPHAMVGSGNRLNNASDRPVNPAIEVEITSGGETETRYAFAKFPDFQSMHAVEGLANLKLFFDYAGPSTDRAAIEVLTMPSGDIYAKFSTDGRTAVTGKIGLGSLHDTPWPGMQLSVLRKFASAGMVRSVVPVEPVRKDRIPAVHVRVSSPDAAHDLWVQRRSRSSVNPGGKLFDVSYTDAMQPLGFKVKLDQFTVGRYPGTQRPRSFESRVTLIDATTGRSKSQVISMNHPVSFGGYTLYQSAYRYEKERAISTLSVARDPGTVIVFVGYIAAILGMIVVLVLRLSQHRQADASAAGTPNRKGRRPICVSLIPPAETLCDGGFDGNGNHRKQGQGAAMGRQALTQPR